jgi:hypothetical protein
MTYIVRLGVDDRNFWATIQAATGWFAIKARAGAGDGGRLTRAPARG